MIDNYNDIMNDWGCCREMVDVISPDCSMSQWAVQKTVTVLANSDYYYTKDEVDYLLEHVTASGVTREQVEEMINAAIAEKADKSEVNELAQQVSANTQSILNTYTKQETNSLLEAYITKLKANEMFANYSKVENTTLILNNQNITI